MTQRILNRRLRAVSGAGFGRNVVGLLISQTIGDHAKKNGRD
jgi:hypothetical protein